MRYIYIILLVMTCSSVFGQDKKKAQYITKEELSGTWQKGSKTIGSGLNQHFIFDKQGGFVLNLYNDGDDARNLIRLKGKYRLNKDEIYFTIISKTYIDGELEIGGMGMTFSLFQFGVASKTKEIKEPNPKEMLDPCYITIISKTNIKLNNQIYYKIK